MRRDVLPINWGALRLWHEKARDVHYLGSYMILIVEGTYCPSSGELYDFDTRRHVLSIIRGAIWFWPEKARTVHHLWSYMILTWEGTYCPSSVELFDFELRSTYSPYSAELYDFDLRRPVPSIIWGALSFWPEKARTVDHLGSSMIFTVEGTYWPSSGELSDFGMRRHVLSIIWGAIWFWRRGRVLPINWGALRFWHEKTRIVHHLRSSMILTWEGTYCPSTGELYDCDMRRHEMSIIWGAIWFWS